MTLHITGRCLGLPRYITLIDNMAHSRDVDNMTHDMTMLIHLCYCWCACRAAVLLCHSFTSAWKSVRSHRWSLARFILRSHIAPFLYVGKLDRFVRLWKVHVCPSVHLWTNLDCLSLHPSANTSLHDHLFVSTSLCMQHFLIYWWTYPSACAPFFHPIYRCTMFVYLCLQSLMTRKHQMHKPPSLPWCMTILDVGVQERWQGCEVGWRLQELLIKTAQESLGNKKWAIWINNDCS